ncbi:hypothetical protein SCUP515_06439 [Seiridium cupressi]
MAPRKAPYNRRFTIKGYNQDYIIWLEENPIASISRIIELEAAGAQPSSHSTAHVSQSSPSGESSIARITQAHPLQPPSGEARVSKRAREDLTDPALPLQNPQPSLIFPSEPRIR